MGKREKRVQDIPKDRISDLPRSLIESILECMTIRDAARTSILSRNWRYIWATLPQVMLDKQFFVESIQNKPFVQYEFVRIINKILLLHSGPILKFSLYIPNIHLNLISDMDQWILALSRNGIKELTLDNSNHDSYKLPSHIYSCLGLTHLTLCNCIMKPPPLAFGGFGNLFSLHLEKMSFSTNNLRTLLPSITVIQRLILKNCTGIENLRIHAPKLKWLIVVDSREFDWQCFKSNRNVKFLCIKLCKEVENVEQGKTVNLMKFLGNLPRIVTLYLDGFFLKLFVAGTVPKWLPTTINHLNQLVLLNFGFNDLNQILCAFCLLRSSPNLRNIAIWASKVDKNDVMEPVLNYLEAPNCMDKTLDKLQVVKVKYMKGVRAELLVIKLLLARSPRLERMIIEKSREIDSNDECPIARELMQFPRASTMVKIIYLD